MPLPFLPRGPEFQIPTTTALNQSDPITAARPDGGWTAVWESDGNDGSSFGVYQQRFDSTGAPVGTETQVNVVTEGGQADPGVVTLTGGGWVVTWDGFDTDDRAIVGRVFGPDGVARSGDFQVSQIEAGRQEDSEIVALSDGGFLVTWETDDGALNDVRARVYDDQGQPEGNAFSILAPDLDDQDNPDVVALSGGGFVVVWEAGLAAVSEDNDIWFQIFDDSASATAPPQRVESSVDGRSTNAARVAALTDGDFVAVWETRDVDNPGGSLGTLGQRISADGTELGPRFQANTVTFDHQENPDVVGLPDGGWIAAWESDGGQDGDGEGVYAQRYDAAGVTVGDETQINTTATGDQGDPRLSVLANGDVVVAWESSRQDGPDTDVYARIFAGSMIGTAGNDRLTDVGTDAMFGEGGNDLLRGRGGFDRIEAGIGDDTVEGGAGNDTILGEAGNDVLDGGFGFDVIDGDIGDDTLSGQNGFDNLSGGAGSDSLTGNFGNDTLSGGIGNDTLEGGLGFDSMIGGAGADFLQARDGFDTLAGDAGDDTLEGNNGNDLLDGGAGNDILEGGLGADTIFGGLGDDRLEGANGFDVLSGGAGDDTVLGNAGNDRVDGGIGNDTLQGGLGADTFMFSSGADVVADFQSNIDAIEIAASLLTQASPVAEDLLGYSSMDSGGNLILDFGDGNTLTFAGLSDFNAIVDHASFV